ncbi:MAG TPA: hypothetical protein VN688_23110 [Gemmataceae bacterium]|nr:hypothetical protein [Gemmataceae bacterium]
MFPIELLRLLQQKPFVPFRLHVTEGTVYDVRHPDLVIATLGFVAIGYPDPAHPGMALTVDIVNIAHVIRIEPIATPPIPASASSN